MLARTLVVLTAVSDDFLSLSRLIWGQCAKLGTTASFHIRKVHPRTGHEGPEREQRYSSTLSLTSTLDGGGWSTPRPGRFTPRRETRYPFYRRLGGPVWRGAKTSPPPGFDPRTVQPVAIRYTDCAVPHPFSMLLVIAIQSFDVVYLRY